MTTEKTDWPYLTFKDGKLYDDAGALFSPVNIRFKDAAAAESWLVENDIRGTVR